MQHAHEAPQCTLPALGAAQLTLLGQLSPRVEVKGLCLLLSRPALDPLHAMRLAPQAFCTQHLQ